MSKDKEAKNMFEADDCSYAMYDVISGKLEEMSSSGDLEGCEILIRYLRRSIADMPVTGYRVMKRPEIITGFLGECGLEQEKDYVVSKSTLDGDSHTIYLNGKSERTHTFIGCLAGLRVKKGASVCDRLYCESIKKSGRDFMRVLTERLLNADANAKLKKYILSCSMDAYLLIVTEFRNGNLEKLAKREGYCESDLTYDIEIAKFAEKQIRDGKLTDSSVPVLPMAVVELYYRLLGKGACYKDIRPVFRIAPDEEKWTATRACRTDSGIPATFYSQVPVQSLRQLYGTFDDIMASDTKSFYESVENGVPNNVVVYTTSKTRCIKNGPEETLGTIQLLRKRQDLLSYMSSAYTLCYPKLSTTFFSESRALISNDNKYYNAVAVGSGEMCEDYRENYEKALNALDNRLSISKDHDIPEIVFSAGFVLSAFTARKTPSNIFHDEIENVQIVVDEPEIQCKSDGKKNKKQKTEEHKPTVQEEWFKTVHGNGCSAPAVPDASSGKDEIRKNLELLSSGSDVISAVATGVVGTIGALASREGGRAHVATRYAEKADASDAFRRNTVYVTQVMSAAGPVKTFSSFIKDLSEGKKTTPPSAPDKCMIRFEEPENVKSIVDAFDETAIQFEHHGRRCCAFSIYAETNIDYDSIVKLFSDNRQAVQTIASNVTKYVTDTLMSNSHVTYSDERMKEIKRAFGKDSTVYRKALAASSGNVEYGRMHVSISEDKYGRTLFAIRVPFETAAVAILVRADVKIFDKIADDIKRSDPSVLVVSRNDWEVDLGNRLFGTKTPIETFEDVICKISSDGHGLGVNTLRASGGIIGTTVVSRDFDFMSDTQQRSPEIDPN